MRNSLFLLASRLTSRVIGVAYLVVLARFLGPEDYGRYALAVTFVTLFSVMAEAGVGTLTIRDVARYKSLASEYFTDGTSLRLILSVCAYALLLGTAWSLGYSVSIILLLAATGMILPIAAISEQIIAIFNSFEHMEVASIAGIALSLSGLLFGSVFVVAGYGPMGAVWGLVFSYIIYLIVVVWIARSSTMFGSLGVTSMASIWHLLKKAFPFSVRAILSVVYFRIDVILLSKMTDFGTLGTYQSAYRLLELFWMLSGVLSNALFPVSSVLHIQSTRKLRTVFERHSLYGILFALPCIVLVVFLAPEIIGLLYPKSFQGAIPILQVLMFAALLIYINAPIANLVVSSNYQRTVTLLSIATASANVLLNLLLIPRMGGLGAAWATVGSEIATTIVFYALVQKILGETTFLRNMVRPFLSMLFAVVVMFILSRVTRLLGLVGLLCYPLGLWVLQVVPQEDRNFFVLSLHRAQSKLKGRIQA